VRRWLSTPTRQPRHAALRLGNTGAFGTGANMAFRRRVFAELGSFDPALDVGTVTNGGGDLEMFYRVLGAGRVLVYEPRAIVRHRHRRGYDELRDQLRDWGSGMYSYVSRSMIERPRERIDFALLVAWLAVVWFGRRFAGSLVRQRWRRELIAREIAGASRGFARYREARARAEANEPRMNADRTAASSRHHPGSRALIHCTVDLDAALGVLDVADAERARIVVRRGTREIGAFVVRTRGEPIGADHLADLIVEHCIGAVPEPTDDELTEFVRNALRDS
jgi:hypothetical protein